MSHLQALGESRVRRGNEGVPYINVDLRSADVRELWSAVREVIRADQALSSCSMVCCEGEYGWDDYLLLHHFDAAETLDELG